ncbi:MAG: GerAB/ArcD/ProY family transporter [Clostridia bacterium]|nr:GerAB/ArcD/ProY family transporter [Clostridia bacterium]
MNDRLGRFGPRELFSLSTICTLLFGCFSTDESGLYDTGNQLHFATLTALLLSVLLLYGCIAGLRRAGADSLGALLRRMPRFWGILTAAALTLALLLAAALPGLRFLRALTGFIYIDANPMRILLYCVPCLVLLSALGMETLCRTGRILLPITLFVTLIGLGSDIPLYRLYRLFPLFTSGEKLLRQSLVSLLRFVPVVLILLTTARGAQGWEHVRRAGTMGLLLGGALTILAEICLGLSYRYTELRELSAPLYRLMVEIDTDNASVRLDRVVLFVWTMAALFASACAVYAASLLLSETAGVRDVRPIAVLLSAVTGTAVLLLRRADDLGIPALFWVHRIGCAFAVLPLAAPMPGRKRRCAA